MALLPPVSATTSHLVSNRHLPPHPGLLLTAITATTAENGV
ncbi:hypothetical protein [Pararhizobium sp. LjRoot238]